MNNMISKSIVFALGEIIANLVIPKELSSDYIMPSALNVITYIIVATDVFN